MIKLDYLYVTNWSLWGDIKLLLRTVFVIIKRRGANSSLQGATRAPRILTLLGNTRYESDTRVPAEAVSLVAAGYDVVVVRRGAPGGARSRTSTASSIRRFRRADSGDGLRGPRLRDRLGHSRLPRARDPHRPAPARRRRPRPQPAGHARPGRGAVQARPPARGLRPPRPRSGARTAPTPRKDGAQSCAACSRGSSGCRAASPIASSRRTAPHRTSRWSAAVSIRLASPSCAMAPFPIASVVTLPPLPSREPSSPSARRAP